MSTSLSLTALVDTIDVVRATSARSAKVAALAELLGQADPAEAPALVGLLLGRIRQGRIGLGWRTLAAATEGREPAAEASLTVADVDNALETIAGIQGAGSTAARGEAIAGLVDRATSGERDFLTHSLLGDVRTGALDGVLTDALAKAIGRPLAEVRRAVMLIGDLGEATALGLADPGSLAGISLRVGVAVQPMLASTATDVAAALEVTGRASVEHKLDGARIQVHRRGQEVSVHTRSLADITDRMPEIVEFARGLPGDQFILDGETLMLDEAGAPRPFQETMSRFGRHTSDEIVLAPRFFDLLALGGEDLTDRPLSQRRALLSDLVGERHLIPGTVTDDPVVAAEVLETALGAGHEGVLIKGIDSTYAAGRRGKSWVKVKPVHTFDLVVLAAEWGFGRRTGWLSNLHLGARDDNGEFGPAGGFVMVGKTFKGLTDEILRWQTETFPSYAVRETPGVVWLRPEIVVEIAIDGVQRSSRYPGGVALRFARVKAYRDDKPAAEADTIESVRALLRD
jgi:DNA ligase-1